MKRILLLAFALALVVTVTVSAGAKTLWGHPYIAMYNPGEDHYYCGITVPAPYSPYEIWVWILPGVNGLKGFSFTIDLGDDLCTGVTNNPDLISPADSPVEGTGWTGYFSSCHYDWVWLTKLSMIALSTAPHCVDISEHPDTGEVEAIDCTEGNPAVPLTVLNSFCVNTPCVVDARDSSWGAVKSIYR